MATKLKISFATIFVLFGLSVSAFGCSCMYSFKADNLTGQVFALQKPQPKQKPELNYEKPVSKAVVRLRQIDDTQKGERKLIAESDVDESGRFSLESIKPGNYILEIYASDYDGLVAFVTVVESSSQKKDKIEIGLPPPAHCCGAYVKIQKTEKKS